MKKILASIILSLLSTITFGQESNFCFTGYNGETTKIILMNGGRGKLNILNNDVITRSGDISWSSTSSNFPNPEIIQIKLSTGRILKFQAVKFNQPNSEIDMLIDSEGNQYLKCFNLYDLEEKLARQAEEYYKEYTVLVDNNKKEIIDFEKNKMPLYFEELQGIWTANFDEEDIFLVIEKDESDKLIVKKYVLNFEANEASKSSSSVSKFHLESEIAGLYDKYFIWTVKLEFGDDKLWFDPQDFDSSKSFKYAHRRFFKGFKKSNSNEDLELLESVDSMNENMEDYYGAITKETIRYTDIPRMGGFPVIFGECLDDYKKQDSKSGENSFDYYLDYATGNKDYDWDRWEALEMCFGLTLNKYIANERNK